MKTRTTPPASVVPEKLGNIVPTTSLASGIRMFGAAGSIVSTTIETTLDIGLVLPAASVACAATSWGPWLGRDTGAKTQSAGPSASVTVVPAAAPSRKTVTVLLGSATP